jgi:hypothetical protein
MRLQAKFGRQQVDRQQTLFTKHGVRRKGAQWRTACTAAATISTGVSSSIVGRLIVGQGSSAQMMIWKDRRPRRNCSTVVVGCPTDGKKALLLHNNTMSYCQLVGSSSNQEKEPPLYYFPPDREEIHMVCWIPYAPIPQSCIERLMDGRKNEGMGTLQLN